MGYCRTADGRDELSAHFDDSGMFCLSANHESGNVVQEDNRSVSVGVSLLSTEPESKTILLVAHSNELRSLSCLVRVDDRQLVGYDTNREACKILILA